MKYAINLFMLFTLTVHANSQIALRFQPHITTHAKYLGDLLVISNSNSSKKQKDDIRLHDELTKTPLDSHPKVDEIITKKQIIDWINHKIGSLNYQWKGKNTAIIEQSSQSTGQELLNKAQAALINYLSTHNYDRIILKPKTLLKNSKLPSSAFTIHIANIYPPTRQICVRLNHKKNSIPVWFELKAYQRVLVARSKAKAHTTVNKNDFILKTRNIAGLKYKPYTQFPPSPWLKQSINKDQILTQNYLAKRPSVIRDQPVQVKILNHGIAITTEAVAQNDGYIGQTVRMKNPKTNQYFVALITAPNKAEITV